MVTLPFRVAKYAPTMADARKARPRQLRGPYTLWHHTHTFEECDGGTLCLDHVRYRPLGGALVHWLFVRRDVERIFNYRQYRLKQLFP